VFTYSCSNFFRLYLGLLHFQPRNRKQNSEQPQNLQHAVGLFTPSSPIGVQFWRAHGQPEGRICNLAKMLPLWPNSEFSASVPPSPRYRSRSNSALWGRVRVIHPQCPLWRQISTGWVYYVALQELNVSVLDFCKKSKSYRPKDTRSSAIAEGPRDASCQLKSCQLPHNSAETTYTTSPDQIDGMKLEI